MSAPPPGATLDDRYTAGRGRVLLSGTQALVRLPLVQRRRDLAAGLNTAGFVSGYRGSPLGGLDREFGRARAHLDAAHVVFRPAINEDMAATAVWGAQQLGLFAGARYDGVFSMWYGKGPGLDRSMDVVRHANAAGAGRFGGVLLLAGDDHGAVSSTIPHQSEYNLISAMAPMLAPAGIAEYTRLGLLGWAMSRFTGAWVGFKCQTEIVESSATVEADDTGLVIVTPAIAPSPDGASLRWPDRSHAMERRLDWKIEAAKAFARANRLDRTTGAGRRARLGLVAAGKSWLDLTGALEALGLDDDRAGKLGVRLRKVGMVWPLEPEGLAAFAEGLDTILVVEEKRPVIEDQIKALLYDLPAASRPRVFGKTDASGAPLLPWVGELDALAVARAILALLGGGDAELSARAAEIEARLARAPALDPSALKREPFFCSGCPHSVSTRVPEGSRASTGIGCHMMVTSMPQRRTATFTQMGGEGGTWIGLSPFTDERHIFVNMGDGTYFHSGVLAIRAAVAAGVNATYKILYNGAVAMTGGQAHDGENTVPSIVGQALAEGARRVVVVAERPEIWAGALPRGVSVRHRDELDETQRELRDIEGVTVLVYDQICAAEKRRRRKRGLHPPPVRRAFINELVCEGCGDCSVQSNCISVEPVETTFGVKRRINQSSCNTDLSCLAGFCPSFVTVEGGRPRRRRGVASAEPDVPLPSPALPDVATTYDILMTGVGGTGVITASAVLAMAAHLDGLDVTTLDQTGLAQKNGAVMSHVRLSRAPASPRSPRIGAGRADVVLAFDALVAASPAALATTGRGRTRILADEEMTPPAAFVRDTTIELRGERVLSGLRDAVGEAGLAILPAARLAEALFGGALGANMLLLGAAWQRGLLPIGLPALERAIELNGADAAMNRAAFHEGRRAAVDPAGARLRAGLATKPVEPGTLAALVDERAAFLVGYQDAAYARDYRELVALAEAAERRLPPGHGGFAEAVARAAFRLMAYKDEYEVARLLADPAFARRIGEEFEGDARVRYHLAPPLLAKTDPRTGRPRKIAFGPWLKGGLRVLAAGKRLRGRRFDPFGHTAERRMERRLIAEYRTLIRELCGRLSADDFDRAVALAALPLDVRGFGPVKAESVAAYHGKRARLLAEPAAGA